MNLQLTGGSGLSDGSDSFNAAAGGGAGDLEHTLDRVRLPPVQRRAVRQRRRPASTRCSSTPVLRHGVRHATRWPSPPAGTSTLERVEADVVFNTAFSWDLVSRQRARRAASGTSAGSRSTSSATCWASTIPTSTASRSSAMMNSITRQPRRAHRRRHCRRAVALWRRASTGNITFPPRNEPNDFFSRCRRSTATSCAPSRHRPIVDPEGRGDLADRVRAPARRPVQPRTATPTRSARSPATAARPVCAETPAAPSRSRRAMKGCCS